MTWLRRHYSVGRFLAIAVACSLLALALVLMATKPTAPALHPAPTMTAGTTTPPVLYCEEATP